jgi:enolase
MPMVNIISGGLHAGRQLDFQDFLVMPVGAGTYREALGWIVDVYDATADVLRERGLTVLKADEGGYGPPLASHAEALRVLDTAVERAGLRLGDDIAYALDIAATHFYEAATGRYVLASEGRTCTAEELAAVIGELADRHPILSVEDALAEDDWAGWTAFTEALGTRLQIVGDDFFTTNIARLERGIAEGAANAVLVKMNQIGTISETLAVVTRAKEAGYRTVISARSGETEDPGLADLAVGTAGGQIKVGSVAQSERLAKYNQLLRIEEELGGDDAPYAGRAALALEPVA